MQTEFFLRFQVAHLDLIIGQKSFESLKPFFVKPIKDQIYYCIYHVKFNELRLALIWWRPKALSMAQKDVVVIMTMCVVNMGNHVKLLLLFIKELFICWRMLCAQHVNLKNGTSSNVCLAIAQCVGYKIYPSTPKNLHDHFLMLSNGVVLL